MTQQCGDTCCVSASLKQASDKKCERLPCHRSLLLLMGARYHSVSATCWWNDFKWDKCLLLQSLVCAIYIYKMSNRSFFILFLETLLPIFNILYKIATHCLVCVCVCMYSGSQHDIVQCCFTQLITPEATHVQIPRHCVYLACKSGQRLHADTGRQTLHIFVHIYCTCAFITHVTDDCISFWKLL